MMDLLLKLLGIDPRVAFAKKNSSDIANAVKSIRVSLVNPDACVVLQDVAGSTLTCTAGRLWITESGQCGDIDLPTGHAIRLQHGGKTLVNSCSPSAFRLEEGSPGGDDCLHR